jgi:hypothetical protein
MRTQEDFTCNLHWVWWCVANICLSSLNCLNVGAVMLFIYAREFTVVREILLSTYALLHNLFVSLSFMHGFAHYMFLDTTV